MGSKPPAPYYELSEHVRRFVVLMCETGGDVKGSYIGAGFAPDRAETEGNRLLRRPEVMAALKAELGRSLALTALRAHHVIKDLVADPQSALSPGAKVRLDAAKTALDRAGIIAPRAAAPKDGADVPLHELSAADLRAMADKLEGELAARARPIEPTEPVSTDQASDLLE